MKKLLIAMTLTLTSLTTLAHDDGKVSIAKVAELAAHRIDRLVTLGKIDAGFLKNLETIQVSKVTNSEPVAFRSLASQTAPASGLPLQIEILSDHDGKTLSFKIIPDGSAGADPKWTDKDAGSLIENGMHYVLENNTLTAVAPYDTNFESMRLTKGKLNDQDVALLSIKSSSQAQQLNIYLKLDGTFITTTVTP